MIVRSTMLSTAGICLCIIALAITIIISVYSSGTERRLQIGCGENRTGIIGPRDTIYFNFTNPTEQSVTFTNCKSDFDTTMYLKDSSGDNIQEQSFNECDGDDCYEYIYCAANSTENTETFTMDPLSPGTYTVELGTYSWAQGTFVVEVVCNMSDHTADAIQYDIQCGETMTGNLSYPETVSLNFTNPQQQDVVFTKCETAFKTGNGYDINTTLSIKNSRGIYVQNQTTNNCDGTDCNEVWCTHSSNVNTLAIDSLAAGQYEVEIMPQYDHAHGGDGTFVMTVICPQWNTFDIECDQSIRGNISIGQTAYFIFQNDKETQDVTFTASNSTFETHLKLRNTLGHYLHDQSVKSKGTSNETLNMDQLVYGLYILELTTQYEGGNFTVEAKCNTTLPTDSAIECGDTVSGDIKRGETVFIEFNNTKKQNVLFTNCPESDTDILYHYSTDGLYYSMFLRNSSGTLIQSRSTNECDGTDCFFAYGYCSPWYAETFVMQNLPEDIYRIELSYQWYNQLVMSNYSVQVVCDPILCDVYHQYDDVPIQSDRYISYRCNHIVDGADSLNYQFCIGESGMDEDEAQLLNNVYEFVDELGLGIQNNVLLLSLLFVNVSTAIFIIIGLNRMSTDRGIRTISTVILLTQLILITSFLSFNPFQFGSCTVSTGEGGMVAPNMFHVLIALICTAICHLWANDTYDSCCCCCKYAISLFLFVVLLFFEWLSAILLFSDHYADSSGVFVILFLFFQSLLPAFLCKLTYRFQFVCQRNLCRCCLLVTSILSVAFSYWVSVNVAITGRLDVVCWIVGGASWVNPLFVFSSFYLLFSEFRILVIFQNFILMIIVLAQQFDESQYFCSVMVNAQYIAHSFLIPIYIFLLFKSVPPLQGLAMSLIGLFLVAIDVYSDFLVVYFFIQENEYIFAFLQMSFIITGQVVGAMSDVFGEHSENLAVIDKVMASVGFGRIWFTVNWWNEVMTQDGIGKYKVLRQKHKIWDLLYEAFPTVTLQIYAAMTTDVALTALVASITISAVCVSFSTILYLRALLGVQQQDNGADDGATVRASSTSIKAPIKREHRQEDVKSIYLTLFVFLVSDFYIRSVPMVMLLAIASVAWFDGEGDRDYFLRFIFGSFIFGAMAIFELFANHKIRMDSHRGLTYILKIFAASIFSSFHTMLCTLNVLRTDAFMGNR